MTRQKELVRAAREEYPEWEEAQCHFIDGAHYADSHPHWISVIDELPKEEGWILICSYSDIDMWYYNGQTAKDLVDYASITHWMPLPQLPKKGEEK